MTSQLSFLRSQPDPSLPIEARYEHELSNGKGEVALQYWPRRDNQTACPTSLTFFILGNPGLLNYYIPFLNHLHSLLPASHALISTSHIGHTPGLRAPSQPLDLLQQLETKVELVGALDTYLKAWAQENGEQPPKLNLMGHSVGSWLMCEVMKRLKDDIHAGYLLFPTVGWLAESWNGRTLWPISRQPFKSLLPMITPLLRPVLPFTTFPATTLSLLRSPETISHALGLMSSELEVMRGPDFEWLESQKSEDPTRGLFGVWAGGNLDGWVGKEGPMVQDLLGGVDGKRVTVLEGVPHAFCLSQENSELVAKTVAGWITQTPQNLHPGHNADALSTAVPV